MVSNTVHSVNFTESLATFLPELKTQIRDMLGKICGRHHMPERIASRVDEYFGRCLDYNIVGGKLARARTVSEVVRVCMGCEFRPESDQAKAALVLGWAIEILQAFFLIEDDVMDRGEVRRGQPCWYKVPDA